jgi:hypothetical protein
MKAILEYNTSNVDEKKELNRAIKSTDMALVLWELKYNSRDNIIEKIGDLNLSTNGIINIRE